MIMQMGNTQFQTTINAHFISLHLKITLMCFGFFSFFFYLGTKHFENNGILHFFFFFTADRPLQIKSIDPIKQCNMRVLQ